MTDLDKSKDNKSFRTQQEDFWAGSFGTDYISRNNSLDLLRSNRIFFNLALKEIAADPKSILELGANIGLNLDVLPEKFPDSHLTAIEINNEACKELLKKGVTVHNSAILETKIDTKFDLVLTKGVLIHLNPESLIQVYRKLYDWSKRYILIGEYYSPNPVELPYRGFEGKLFKRDFAGEFVDLFPNVRLIDYGFAYHRDVNPQDDITWFLLEKHES